MTTKKPDDTDLETLRDGRTVWIGSEKVTDVTTHPAFRNGARSMAAIYVKHSSDNRFVANEVRDTSLQLRGDSARNVFEGNLLKGDGYLLLAYLQSGLWTYPHDNSMTGDTVLKTDLSSMFYCTSAVVAGMRERNYGRIINISSIIGQSGNVGQANYAAAKAGVIAFTKTAAKELARNQITVNAVCPGFIETDMVAALTDEVKDRKVDAHYMETRLPDIPIICR